MLNDRFGAPKAEVREFFEAELRNAKSDPRRGDCTVRIG
jgi:hypothetical protein